MTSFIVTHSHSVGFLVLQLKFPLDDDDGDGDDDILAGAAPAATAAAAAADDDDDYIQQFSAMPCLQLSPWIQCKIELIFGQEMVQSQFIANMCYQNIHTVNPFKPNGISNRYQLA